MYGMVKCLENIQEEINIVIVLIVVMIGKYSV